MNSVLDIIRSTSPFMPVYGWIIIVLGIFNIALAATFIIRVKWSCIEIPDPAIRLLLISFVTLLGITELSYVLANLLWHAIGGTQVMLIADTVAGASPSLRPAIAELYHTIAGIIRPITNCIFLISLTILKRKRSEAPWRLF